MSAPIDRQCVITLLCRGATAAGEPYWAYLEISAGRVKAFRKAQQRGAFRLEDFGTLIEWGMGEEPPADIKARMEREHAVDHQFHARAAQLFREKSG